MVHFGLILGLGITLDQFRVQESPWANLESGGHFGAILSLRVSFCQFSVRNSFCADFAFEGHLGPNSGLGSLSAHFGFGGLHPP